MVPTEEGRWKGTSCMHHWDRVSLLEASFVRNPVRTVSLFDEVRQLIGTILFRNAYVGNGAGPLSSRVLSAPNSSPRS